MTRRLLFAWRVAWMFALPALAATNVSVSGDIVLCQRDDGMVVWRAVVSNPALLDNGVNLDARGRLLSSRPVGTRTASGGYSATAPSWDPLTNLSSAGGLIGPVFDSLDNAWAVVVDSGGATRIVRSTGASGAWQTTFTFPEPVSDIGGGEFAAGSAGAMYLVYAAYGDGYELRWTSYTTDGGWQAPQTFYSSPIFTGAPELKIDFAGNLVVVFDQGSADSEAWSIVHSASDGSWGPALRISPAGSEALIQTTRQSPDGSTILLVYFLFERGRSAIYSSRYAASTMTFDTPTPIPATGLAAFSIATTGTEYPLTIDAQGNATLLAPLYTRRENTIFGFRYEDGRWTTRTQLLPLSNGFEDILNFGDIAQNASSDVLGIMSEDTPANQFLYGFRFNSITGWSTETIRTLSPNLALTRTRIAWFEFSGEAVATYFGGSELDAAVYNGGDWNDSPAIPGGYYGILHETATAPSGEVLLLIDGSTGGGPPTGDLATWLRP